MELVNLKLFGPFKFTNGRSSVFSDKLSNERGIYLWTVKYKDGYLVYYVGETGKSFNDRFKIHLDNLKSGQYRIYDPKLFTQGNKKLIWNPYKRGALKRVRYKKEFNAIYNSIQQQLENYIKLFELFLIPFKDKDRLRLRIEAAISMRLNKAGEPIGSFQDEDIKYKPRKETEVTLSVKLSSPFKIHGLQRNLEV